MRHLTALALAVVCACSGYTDGQNATGGGPTGLDSDGGGDGGSDGGDGGGLSGFDAGCAAFSASTLGVLDGCISSIPQPGTASVSVAPPDAGNACATSITLTTGTGACGGISSHGTLNAFSGACAAMTCTSPSLPGKLTCTGGCIIQICDGGVCGP